MTKTAKTAAPAAEARARASDDELLAAIAQQPAEKFEKVQRMVDAMRALGFTASLGRVGRLMEGVQPAKAAKKPAAKRAATTKKPAAKKGAAKPAAKKGAPAKKAA